MSRIDHKVGRFSSDFETNEINDALEGFQRITGDKINWFKFNRATSAVNDIYDEGDLQGRVYDGPYEIPVLHVTRNEGRNEDTDLGFYTNDEMHVTASFQQIVNSGLTHADLKHQSYLRDRLVYDRRVFRITDIQILGQIQRRDLVVGIDATQVKADEMVNELGFYDKSFGSLIDYS